MTNTEAQLSHQHRDFGQMLFIKLQTMDKQGIALSHFATCKILMRSAYIGGITLQRG